MPSVSTKPSPRQVETPFTQAPGDHSDESALSPPAALQQPVGEVAAAAHLGHLQRDRPGARVEGPLAVAVAAVHALTRAFTEGRPTERIRLGAHERLGERLHHFTQQIGLGLGELLAQPAEKVDVVVGH